MAETPKRGFFSRLLGIPVQPEPDPEPQIDERFEREPEPSTPETSHVPETPLPLDIPDVVAMPEPVEPEIDELEREPVPEPLDASFEPAHAAPESELFAPTVAPQSSQEDAAAEARSFGWLGRLREGLQRTSDRLGTGITDLFTKSRLDATTLDELEDLLIQADLGVDTAMRITEEVGRQRHERGLDAQGVRAVVASEVEKALQKVAQPLVVDAAQKPFVILMVGVNGSGKTTTIGKLTQKFGSEGKSVWLAAGDTFRAAAVEQLRVWAERTGVPIVTKPVGADASGLAYEAMESAREAEADVLMIDTAGRLQNRTELMQELEKITRVIRKVDATAPHAVLLVLDATVGQNALSQVDAFRKTAGVTGLVMTKLDGTARGGILVAVAEKFGLPIHFIGVGESVGDLEPFAPRDFARALVGLES
jgi:fused signal recognition particle receptor